MNERFKELAWQSGLGDHLWIDHPDMPDDNAVIEKFAELILSDIDNIIDSLYRKLPLEQAAVLLTLDENIKEHFWSL